MCLCWNMAVLSSLWMGVSVSLVEHVIALTTVDVYVCAYDGTGQSCDHCGWVLLCLWCNMSMLRPQCMGVSVSLLEYVIALTMVDRCVCVSGGICQHSDHWG